jgi:hypothetical protein
MVKGSGGEWVGEIVEMEIRTNSFKVAGSQAFKRVKVVVR